MINLKKEFEELTISREELIEMMPERTIEYFLVRRMYKSLRGQGFESHLCITDCALKFAISERKVSLIIYGG